MTKDVHQISVRGFRSSELEMMRNYAQKNGFESLNAFLLWIIRDELENQTMLHYGSRTVQYIENSARVMNNQIDAFNSFTANNERVLDRVEQLLEILSE